MTVDFEWAIRKLQSIRLQIGAVFVRRKADCNCRPVSRDAMGTRIEVHHEIVAMSIQPCSKASNERANPDRAIIRITRKSSEIERKEPEIIRCPNKKVETRTVVLSNVNLPRSEEHTSEL